MTVPNFRLAKKAVLLGLYDHMMKSTGAEWLPVEEISGVLTDTLPIVYVRKILESLEEEELVESRVRPNLGYSTYSIAERGILTVQAGLSLGDDDALPEGVSKLESPRFLVSNGPVPEGFEGREGDLLIELDDDQASGQLVPASDRMVPLNHNSAPYLEVQAGLAELHEELRTTNDLECAPEERERLLISLSAAQKLWEAAQLKISQIKVGIIITIQDAIDLLTKAGKAVGKVALIDLIKSIVKHGTGIDL